MIIAEPSETFTATAIAAPDLVGTIGSRIMKADGITAAGGDRSTAGFVELLQPGGIHTGYYTLSRTAPGVQGRYTVLIDTGTLSPQTISTTELIVALHGEVLIGAQEYAPTVADVASYIPIRAVDANGNQLGTFTLDTTPTQAQVETIIRGAAAKLATRVGDTVAAALAISAREVVALRAALMVELTFFGDQIATARSPYNELKALYDESLKEFLEARLDLGADETAGSTDDLSAGGLAVYSFPDPFVHVPGAESPWPASYGYLWPIW